MNSIEYKIIYDLFNDMPLMDNNIAGMIEQYIYKDVKVSKIKKNRIQNENRNMHQIEDNVEDEVENEIEGENTELQNITCVTMYTLRYENFHGKYISFEIETNRKMIECNYNNGKLDGEKIRYYRNGNIMKKETYVNDLLDGVVQRYNGNGTLMYSFTYKNGIQHGPFLEWYTNGEISSEGTYENGFLKGIYRTYYSREDLRNNNTNNLCSILYFNNFGTIDGTIKKYCENGVLTMEAEYKNGQKNGYFKKYSRRNGSIVKELNYKNGLLDGEYKENIVNGISLIHCNYKKGKLHSFFKKYYITGDLNIETNYNNGYIDGNYIVYDKNKNIIINQVYKYEDKINLNFMNELEEEHIYFDHSSNY